MDREQHGCDKGPSHEFPSPQKYGKKNQRDVQDDVCQPERYPAFDNRQSQMTDYDGQSGKTAGDHLCRRIEQIRGSSHKKRSGKDPEQIFSSFGKQRFFHSKPPSLISVYSVYHE